MKYDYNGGRVAKVTTKMRGFFSFDWCRSSTPRPKMSTKDQYARSPQHEQLAHRGSYSTLNAGSPHDTPG